MDKDLKKVGILTLYEGNYNYGGTLQAYALCKTINNLGYDCSVISYIGDKNPIYPSLKEQMKQYSKKEALKKIIEKVRSKYTPRNFKKIYLERKKLIDNFKNDYIPHTELYDDKKVKENYGNFDAYVSGSDQVWNPNCARFGFLQMFPKNNLRKISYAASISRNNLSENELKIMIPSIQDFDYIGVREKTAKKLLESKINKSIEITLDPTLLLEKEKWNSLTNNVEFEHNNYVLCYFFSDSRKYRRIIYDFCKKNNLKLIYIPYAKQEYNNFDNKGAGYAVKNVSPQEFLLLFKNAKYIFTDSFHGAVFSLIFEKKFLIFERSKNTKVSMNSRLYDLLNMVNLNDRMIKIDDEIQSKIVEEIDYNKIKTVLEEKQKESINFLKNALK